MKVKKSLIILLAWLLLLSLSGCNQKTKRATDSSKTVTTGVDASSDFKLDTKYKENLFQNQKVTMKLQSCYYDATTHQFVIESQINNDSSQAISIETQTCLVHGYQIPVSEHDNTVASKKTSQATFSISEAELKKASVTFGGVEVTFVVKDLKSDHVLEKDEVGIPRFQFAHFEDSSVIWVGDNQKEERINKLFINTQNIKAALDYCRVDEKNKQAIIDIRMINSSKKTIQLVYGSITPNGDLTSGATIVQAGNSMICECVVDHLKKSPDKTGLTLQLALMDVNEHELILKRSLDISKSDFKSI